MKQPQQRKQIVTNKQTTELLIKVMKIKLMKKILLNNNVNKENKMETSSTKEKFSNLFGKLKNIKLKKPSLDGIKLPKSPSLKKNNSITKVLDFLKSKIGKSSIQGEEIVGVELNNKSIRLAQINADKSNQWVLEKFYTHKIDIPDESSVLDNSEKISHRINSSYSKI